MSEDDSEVQAVVDDDVESLRSEMKRMTALGYPVIPCNGKKPMLQRWTDFSVATDSQIDEWFVQYSSSLTTYGVPMGKASGLVGIDEDGPLAEGKLLEISDGVLDDTWTYYTPSGGRHRIFGLTPDSACKPKKFTLDGEHSELSLMGNGQQMIFAPGSTEQGKYRWDERLNPDTMKRPATAPKWLLDLVNGEGSVTKPAAGVSEAKTEQTPEQSDEFAQKVLSRLCARCEKFREACGAQKRAGLPEDEWQLHLRNLSRAGHPAAAQLFSEMSVKHGPRSDERLQSFADEGAGAMVRCTTFGCGLEQIAHCFGGQIRQKDGEITNSPGSFVVNMEAVLPPTGAVYGPYLEVSSKTPMYDIDQEGNLLSYDAKDRVFHVSNFVARPVSETVRDDGISETRTIRIEGVQSGRLLREVEVQSADFSKLDWVMEKWGLQAAIRPGANRKDLVRDFVQRMAPLAEHRTIYTHLGWRKVEGDGWVYLHAAGAVGAEDVSVELGPYLSKYRLPPTPDDIASAAQASLALLELAPHRVTIPLLGVTYLSPLLESLRGAGIEPTFIVWLAGTTGTRKTSIGKVFLSHYGSQFASGSIPASFKDTANAIERKAFATKDALLLVDDFVPSGPQSQAEKTAQQLIRGYGDRVARGRLMSSTEFQTSYQPRGMALVTGEDFPAGHSSNARLFGVELRPGEVNLDALTKAQDQAGKLAEAMAGYIEYLRSQMDDLPQRLTDFGD